MKTPVAIFILLMMTTACNLLQSPEPDAAAPIQIETPAPLAQLNIPQPGYQLYLAEEYGVAFQYPEGWFLLDAPDEIKALNNGYTVTLASYDIMSAPGRDGVDPNQTKVDVSIGTLNTMFGDDLQLDSLETYMSNGDSGVEILSSERRTLPGGTEMLITTLRNAYNPDATTTYTTIINGIAVNIGGFGDTTGVETIAMSVQAYP